MIIKKHVAESTKKALSFISQNFKDDALIISSTKVNGQDIVYFALDEGSKPTLVCDYDLTPSEQVIVSPEIKKPTENWESLAINELFRSHAAEQKLSTLEKVRNAADLMLQESHTTIGSELPFPQSLPEVAGIQAEANDNILIPILEDAEVDSISSKSPHGSSVEQSLIKQLTSLNDNLSRINDLLETTAHTQLLIIDKINILTNNASDNQTKSFQDDASNADTNIKKQVELAHKTKSTDKVSTQSIKRKKATTSRPRTRAHNTKTGSANKSVAL
jgi:flagellar biosynthesis GTPase FlhF